MIVGVIGDDLIARFGPDTYEQALARLGAREFDVTGRLMRGWVLVAGESLDGETLTSWINAAQAYVDTLPPN
jgi:hypothetical protein